jgi:hypothetical protein
MVGSPYRRLNIFEFNNIFIGRRAKMKQILQ